MTYEEDSTNDIEHLRSFIKELRATNIGLNSELQQAYASLSLYIQDEGNRPVSCQLNDGKWPCETSNDKAEKLGKLAERIRRDLSYEKRWHEDTRAEMEQVANNLQDAMRRVGLLEKIVVDQANGAELSEKELEEIRILVESEAADTAIDSGEI